MEMERVLFEKSFEAADKETGETSIIFFPPSVCLSVCPLAPSTPSIRCTSPNMNVLLRVRYLFHSAPVEIIYFVES